MNKHYVAACEQLGYDPAAIMPNYSMVPEVHRLALESHFQLIIIAEARNERRVPNWNDPDEVRYQLYPDIETSNENKDGSGLSFDVLGHDYTLTGVGARLTFFDGAVIRQFFDDCKDLLENYLLMGRI